MKFSLLIFLTLLLLSACNGDKPQPPAIQYTVEQHCSSEVDRKAYAQFVVDCSTAANPKSDEEGEDLVRQCEYTGEATLCPEHRHKHTVINTNGGRMVSEKIEEVDNNDKVITLETP